MPDSLQPYGLQHARLLCPPLSLRVCSNLSWWCYLPITSSVTLFFCLQSFLASGSFSISQLSASGGQSIGASASASVLPMNIFWFSWKLKYQVLSGRFPEQLLLHFPFPLFYAKQQDYPVQVAFSMHWRSFPFQPFPKSLCNKFHYFSYNSHEELGLQSWASWGLEGEPWLTWASSSKVQLQHGDNSTHLGRVVLRI